MRIVEPEVIQRQEKDLIESIKSLFLFDVFCQEFNNNYKITLVELEELNGGEIVVRQNKILFQFKAFIKVSFAILIDRQGDYVGFDSLDDQIELVDEANEHQHMILSIPDTIRQKEEEIVRAISQEIESKNIEILFEKEFKVKLAGDCQLKDGNLTIFNNTVAYRLNYTAGLLLNLHIDMGGNLIELNPQEHSPVDSLNAGDSF